MQISIKVNVKIQHIAGECFTPPPYPLPHLLDPPGLRTAVLGCSRHIAASYLCHKVSVLLSSGFPHNRDKPPSSSAEPRVHEMGAHQEKQNLLGHLLSFMVFGEKL